MTPAQYTRLCEIWAAYHALRRKAEAIAARFERVMSGASLH